MKKKISYVIADGLDLNFFFEKQSAEAYMEAIDVKDGVYVGYDAQGRLLKILAKGHASEIELAEITPSHSVELKKLLKDFLREIGRNAKDDNLESLIEACENLAR